MVLYCDYKHLGDFKKITYFLVCSQNALMSLNTDILFYHSKIFFSNDKRHMLSVENLEGKRH